MINVTISTYLLGALFLHQEILVTKGEYKNLKRINSIQIEVDEFGLPYLDGTIVARKKT